MDHLGENQLILLSGFALTGFFCLIATLWLTRRSRVQERLDDISCGSTGHSTDAQGTGSAHSKKSASHSSEGGDTAELGNRVMQAGMYRPKMIAIFQTVRLALSLIPAVLSFIAFQTSLISLTWAVLFGVGAGVFGYLAPSLWLDYQKSGRQTSLRRALPDALDVIIICVEAGLSIQAAMAKVSRELSSVHPLLATEMAICQREMQLGASAGEALNRLAQRFDLAEVRSLASVINQAERFGASVINALRVHAQTLREKRFQRAEELAQKAGVKLVFPTIAFIFPSLFVVLAGPAVVRIFGMFDKMAL